MGYIENYFKTAEKREEQCKAFFNAFTEEENIVKSKREIGRLMKLLDEEQVKCSTLMNKRYNSDYEQINRKTIIKYDGHNSTVYFDADTGMACDEPAAGEAYIYRVTLKNGTIKLVSGYCFPLGGVVRRTYTYSIPTDNKRIRLTLKSEMVMPIIESTKAYFIETNFSGEKSEVYLESLSPNMGRWYQKENYGLNIDATYFLNKMYDLDRESYDSLDLLDVLNYSRSVPSFELIIRTAPENVITKLLRLNLPKAGTIARMLGMSEADYQKSIDNNTLVRYIDFKEFLDKNIGEVDLINAGLDTKTTADWLDYLEKCSAWEQDLDFYSVGYDSHLENTLIKAYTGKDYYYHCKNIANHYKFGKFCKYVVDETINQGYSGIRTFCSELHDYINMCGDLDVKPTLYSSYLHQTHDITSRNHKIKLEKEQEVIFKKRYEDFKPYKKEKYSIIAPEEAKDVQREGDQMNNCIASYIKRIIDGSCLILFLRYTTDLTRSLVSLEIRGNALVQAKQSHNNRINQEQQQFLQEFCKARKLEYKA